MKRGDPSRRVSHPGKIFRNQKRKTQVLLHGYNICDCQRVFPVITTSSGSWSTEWSLNNGNGRFDNADIGTILQSLRIHVELCNALDMKLGKINWCLIVLLVYHAYIFILCRCLSNSFFFTINVSILGNNDYPSYSNIIMITTFNVKDNTKRTIL